MTLLLTVFAAMAASVVWYCTGANGKMKLGVLCLMYWGAALMWLADAVVEYLRVGAEYFTPTAEDMLNDAFLGFSVIALGLVIWFVILLIKDPEGKVKRALNNK